MNKKYFIYAASALAFTACSNDDFVGNNGGNEPSTGEAAILFGGNAGKITRATSNDGATAQEKLDYKFKIYGVKKTSSTKYADVFKNYMLWWDNGKTSTSNSNGWEYVGEIGKHGQDGSKATLQSQQTIKYWDYSSDDYHFVAIAGDDAATFKLDDTSGDITSATFKGLKGHINANKVGEGVWTAATAPNPIYVAEPVIAKKTNSAGKSDYQNVVQFNFIRQQSKVRVGIYGSIPGYKISSIQFYKQGDSGLELDNENKNNVILTSTTANYFIGTNSSNSEGSGTINYTWTGEGAPKYSLSYAETTNFERAKNWYGGEFKNGIVATTSTESEKSKLYGVDKDMESTGYFTVMPTAEDASAILIKCDYTLTSTDGSHETIKVTGATAAIPAAFCKWNSNTTYTYIFKISQNTNGTTGTGSDPVGLFPITFDAVVEDSKSMTEQGTITTITTPSITTYQAGSVTTDGIKYVTSKPIEVTVTESTSGTVQTLTETTNTVGHVAVYKIGENITEADLQVSSVATAQIKVANEQTITLDTSNNKFTFTPSEAGNYAIQYQIQTNGSTTAGEATTAAYTYKIVKVE